MKKILTALLSAVLLGTALLPLSAGATTAIPDPDGNGSIGISDQVTILTYLAGRHEPTNLTAYDVDENGIVSHMDAKCIELYLAQQWNGED